MITTAIINRVQNFLVGHKPMPCPYCGKDRDYRTVVHRENDNTFVEDICVYCSDNCGASDEILMSTRIIMAPTLAAEIKK